MVRRNLTQKKPQKIKLNRIQSGDIKYVGHERTDWSDFGSYEEAEMEIYHNNRHYAYYYTLKDTNRWMHVFLKEKGLTNLLKLVNRTSDNWFTTSHGGHCKMILDGAPYSEERVNKLINNIEEIARKYSIDTVEVDESIQKNNISPAERLKRKTDNIIADLEDVCDSWNTIDDLNVYNTLQSEEASYSTAKAIVDYYTPLLNELKELTINKTPDLVEAYRGLSVKDRKKKLDFISSIVADATRYANSKKATRVVRKPKVKSASQQVSKLKYLKESNELKIKSIDPQKIVGADCAYLYDAATRMLSVITTNSPSGLAVKGSTIINVKSCERKKIRKPDTVLHEIVSSTKSKAWTTFQKLTTKPAECSPRTSDRTIIVKVY